MKWIHPGSGRCDSGVSSSPARHHHGAKSNKASSTATRGQVRHLRWLWGGQKRLCTAEIRAQLAFPATSWVCVLDLITIFIFLLHPNLQQIRLFLLAVLRSPAVNQVIGKAVQQWLFQFITVCVDSPERTESLQNAFFLFFFQGQEFLFEAGEKKKKKDKKEEEKKSTFHPRKIWCKQKLRKALLWGSRGAACSARSPGCPRTAAWRKTQPPGAKPMVFSSPSCCNLSKSTHSCEHSHFDEPAFSNGKPNQSETTTERPFSWKSPNLP